MTYFNCFIFLSQFGMALYLIYETIVIRNYMKEYDLLENELKEYKVKYNHLRSSCCTECAECCVKCTKRDKTKNTND